MTIIPNRLKAYVGGKRRDPREDLVVHAGRWRKAPRDQTGIKRWYMLGPLDGMKLTPYAEKESRRRKAARKATRQARKRSRGLSAHPTGGRRG